MRSAAEGAATGRPDRAQFETTAEAVCDTICGDASAAGGGRAGAVLAGAGLDVVVLEAGLSYGDADFDGDELNAYRRLYWAGAAATTDDGGILLLAGECLGGTTTINYTTSFAPPERL